MAGKQPERNDDGLFEMQEGRQFSSSEKSTVTIFATIATNLQGKQTNLARQEAMNRTASAICSLMLYDVGFKCIVGKKSKQWRNG
jgi:hypothetical protein